MSWLICSEDDNSVRRTDQVPFYGCVRQRDFCNGSSACCGDIIYLDRSIPSNLLTAILTHEMAHAAVFSLLADDEYSAPASDGERMALQKVSWSLLPAGNKLLNPRSHRNCIPVWLNEAIAHSAEHAIAGETDNLSPRFEEYFTRPEACPCLFDRGTLSFASYRGGCRVAGLRFLDSLIRTSDFRISHADIIRAASDRDNGLECLTGKSFAELFREWILSELRSSIQNPNQRGVTIRELNFCDSLTPYD